MECASRIPSQVNGNLLYDTTALQTYQNGKTGCYFGILFFGWIKHKYPPPRPKRENSLVDFEVEQIYNKQKIVRYQERRRSYVVGRLPTIMRRDSAALCQITVVWARPPGARRNG